jgi:luciferase-type oxidoreductase
MWIDEQQATFQPLNGAYQSVFQPDRLTLGLVVPIEAYPTAPVPSLERHLERVRLAEELGFRAVWLRDVPFNVPSFGDAGQVFDPFVYLGALATTTERIALGVASIILPLRHPAHVAKAAASVDVLSGGRLLLGVASGDRPDEYPAMRKSFGDRGARFRDSLKYIEEVAKPWPKCDTEQGTLMSTMDMLPKPTAGAIPTLITGSSQQSPEWIAAHGHGWMTYPRPAAAQAQVISEYRGRLVRSGARNKPVMQSLYIDLLDDPDAQATPIHLGLRLGSATLRTHLEELRAAGVNHVALNLRFNHAPIETTLERLATDVLPTFHQRDLS